jgi:hypothetical protein
MANTAEAKQIRKIPPIDYTSRDFKSIKADLIRSIPYFTPEWTDHNDSDLGIVLLDLEAHAADVLHYYVDRHLNEGFLGTAITRRSVINLLKLIDFKLRSAVPASVDLVFTIPPLPGNLLIPAGTQCQTAADSTGEPVFFETAEDATILAGQTTVTVGAVEGQTKTEELGGSEGIPHQSIVLSGNPIIDGTPQVFVDEGVGFELWTEVGNFIESDENSKTFTTQRDEDETLTLFFGDGVQGKIPVFGSPIRAVYRVGGGARGNVGSDTITAVVTPITFNASPVSVEVTNPAQASGGEERQSIEEARILGPQSVRANDRAVSSADFETLAEQFGGVAKARLFTAPTPIPDRALGCCCQLTMAIAPEGGGQPSSVLINDLFEFLDERKMAGTCLQIIGPQYVKVDVVGEVHIASNFAQDTVLSDLLDRIDDFFDLTGEFVDFETPVFLSDVFRLIDETQGVDHVDLTMMTRRPEPVKEVWPANGATFNVTCAPTTEEAIEPCDQSKDEDWLVTFVSETQFNLRDGTGMILGTFNLGEQVTCEQTGNRVAFCISPGTAAMCPGDRAKFRTAKRVGNVPIGPLEIPIKGRVDLTPVGGARSQVACP